LPFDDESPVVPRDNQTTYISYLRLEELLQLQVPASSPAEHDEMLFIVIHQVYELWFKQILHEVGASATALRQGELMRFYRHLRRINTIQETLTNQVSILETMTPAEFNRFRERLNPASGFQSLQFRLLEFKLGARYPEYLKFHNSNRAGQDELAAELSKPSVYDEFLRCLASKGLAIPDAVLKRDFSQVYTSDATVRATFLSIYEQSEKNYDLFLVLEALLDLDQKFLLWRYRHVSMVERMIGGLRGTGGSTGVKYLGSTLAKRFFPEIWEVRNAMY